VRAAIPDLGLVTVKILDIQEDVITLEGNLTQSDGSLVRNVFYLHYTSVIIVT
jgi:hypothetical protein